MMNGETCKFKRLLLASRHVDLTSAWVKSEACIFVVQALATEGFPVMRNFGDYKELRRLKLFDKTMDAASCSPYTTGVQSWILAGLGSGARIAATCCSRGKVPISGLVLLSYPLFEATPPVGRGAGQPDSTKQVQTI
jgi:predicted alpha/beta-hydrolase family hydrolase